MPVQLPKEIQDYLRAVLGPDWLQAAAKTRVPCNKCPAYHVAGKDGLPICFNCPAYTHHVALNGLEKIIDKSGD